MDFWFLVFIFSVALMVSVGGALLLVGYVGTLPAALSFGWRNWVPALLVPVAGPVWFSARHWKEFSRPGKQLIMGLILVAAALALLYGAGPYFVDRMATGVK